MKKLIGIAICLVVISFMPMFQVYNRGGVIASTTEGSSQYMVKGNLVLKENAEECNPKTGTGLYSPVGLVIRLAQDKDKEDPYKISKIGIF